MKPNKAVITRMTAAIKRSPPHGYVNEVWVQVIKHHRELTGLPAREIAALLGLLPSYAAEVSKAMKIAPRLVAAGVEPRRL